MTQDYGVQYNTYPVFSKDDGFEPAVKRHTPMPTPRDVYDYALMGLPKTFPLTKEPITVDMVTPFLNNAITQIEMDTGMSLSPVYYDQAFDYIDGSFEANFSGFKLQQWPATEIVSMQLKFPHVTARNPYQTYTIPPAWVSLRRNRVNVIAAFGAVSIQTDNSNVATAGGIFSYITGFARGAYQPAIVEIKYKAGWDSDKMPTTVSDLIKNKAALYFLQDIAALLFPVAGVSVGIDGVSQSASMPGPSLLVQRIQDLTTRVEKQKNAIAKVMGRTIKMSFIGA